MKIQMIRGLLLGALCLTAGSAGAEVYNLCAAASTETFTGDDVPIWGYGLDDGGPCVVSIPGPQLTVTNDGTLTDGTLTINLRNELTEPTSIVIPGQAMPDSASANWPVFVEGDEAGTISYERTSTTQRVRSFGVEAAPDGARSYYWGDIGPGTFIYHSGTHPQKQVYMGLYGAVTQDASPGVLYPDDPATTTVDESVPYDNEVVLFYSELDPALNASIACAPDPATCPAGVDPYSTSIHYHPQWFLVNGKPYVDGMTADISAGASGDSTLLRFLSTTGETHVPTLQSLYMTIHAEDGNRYTWQDSATGDATPAPREQYSVMMPPLKTKDAIIQASNGRYAVYDGNGYMTNPSDPGNFDDGDTVGGMLRFLAVGAIDGDEDGFLSDVDCNDKDATTYPGAPEIFDGVDNNCDGTVDEGVDDDLDGVPNSADNCPATPTGQAVDANGCSADQLDVDEDGYTGDVDCNDSDAAINPGATEVFDGVDNDCDGTVDEGLDDDLDGVQNSADICPATPAGQAVDTNGCSADQRDDDGDGYTGDVDCDDSNAAVNPGATEMEDGIDNNCDGQVDEGFGNAVPVADDDAYSVNEDAVLTVNAANGVLNGDTDADGDTLTATWLSGPSHGTLSLNADGSFTYNSEPDWNSDLDPPGPDSFTYVANDGTGDSNIATVSITVVSQNDAPVANPGGAVDEFFLTRMDSQPFAAPGVLGNDNDVDLLPFDPSRLTAVLDTDVNRGTLTPTLDGGLQWSGGFKYAPPNGPRVGTVATFQYHAFDGAASSNIATVSLIRKLSVKTATCELDTEPNPDECAWVIEGRAQNASVPRGSIIQVWLNGVTLLDEYTRGGGQNWGIDVQGSTIVPNAGDTVTVRAYERQPNGDLTPIANAEITGFPVNIE